MPRSARIIIPGSPHHVVQRGQNRQLIFVDNSDRLLYLQTLKSAFEFHCIETHGYCLMPNHIHLVVIPRNKTSLSEALGFSHRVYSNKYNRRHKRKGKLWESRFFSCPLDERHFIHALLYVDCNPVRARLVESPQQYPWSSAVAHSGRDDPAELIDPAIWKRIAKDYGWEEIVKQKLDEEFVSDLRQHTLTGRPLGRF